ncbi:hypothetical protein SPHV1_2270025 [Novosphingobium sp. KN65.2]|nr:hypothetical protein SPHV1_2270025 [Novosphingobium sp. KN65.2]
MKQGRGQMWASGRQFRCDWAGLPSLTEPDRKVSGLSAAFAQSLPAGGDAHAESRGNGYENQRSGDTCGYDSGSCQVQGFADDLFGRLRAIDLRQSCSFAHRDPPQSCDLVQASVQPYSGTDYLHLLNTFLALDYPKEGDIKNFLVGSGCFHGCNALRAQHALQRTVPETVQSCGALAPSGDQARPIE